MGDNVTLTLEVVEKNTQALAAINTHLATVNKTVQSVEKNGQSLARTFKSSWTELASAVAVVQRAFTVVKREVAATISATVQYANELRSLNQINDQSAESNSRLVQVLDDHKVGLQELMMTQRQLSRDGKTLTTDYLAAVADKYNAATTQVERNKIAQESLGRSWKKYIELLQLGGDAILAETKAVSGNLIMTQEQIDRAREYEKAIDELGDSFMGLKIQAGNAIIPIAIEGLDTLTKFFESDIVTRELNNIKIAAGETSGELKKVGSELHWDPKWGPEIRTYYQEARLGAITYQEALDKLGDTSGMTDRQVIHLARSIMDAANEGDSATSNYMAMAAALEQTGQQAAATTTAFWGQNYALEDYSGMLSTVTDYAKMYDQASRDTEAALQAVTDAETELADLRATRPWDVKAIEAATEKVNETRAAVDELKAAQDAQTAAWVNNLILQQLAQDGLTAAEMDYILQIKVKSGEMTQAAADAAQAAYDEAMKVAEALAMLDGKQVNVDINLITHGSQWVGGGGGGGGDVVFANSGANIPAGGWGVVGDAPGGQWTPYTELVYAPHGATVYSAAQSQAMGIPHYAEGGQLAPASSGGTVNEIKVYVTGNNISDQLDLETVALTVAERIKRSIQQ